MRRSDRWVVRAVIGQMNEQAHSTAVMTRKNAMFERYLEKYTSLLMSRRTLRLELQRQLLYLYNNVHLTIVFLTSDNDVGLEA